MDRVEYCASLQKKTEELSNKVDDLLVERKNAERRTWKALKEKFEPDAKSLPDAKFLVAGFSGENSVASNSGSGYYGDDWSRTTFDPYSDEDIKNRIEVILDLEKKIPILEREISGFKEQDVVSYLKNLLEEDSAK